MLDAAVHAIMHATGPLRPSVGPHEDQRRVASVLCESSDEFPFETSQDTTATPPPSRVIHPQRIHADGFVLRPPNLKDCQSQEDLFDDPRGRVLYTLSTIGLAKNTHRQKWTEASAEGDASRTALSKLLTKRFVTRVEGKKWEKERMVGLVKVGKPTFIADPSPRMPHCVEILAVLAQVGLQAYAEYASLEYNLLILNRRSAWIYDTVKRESKPETVVRVMELDAISQQPDRRHNACCCLHSRITLHRI